jgi:hypothetical protein
MEALAPLEQVAIGRPRMRRTSGHLGPSEVLRGDLAVPRGQVELDGRLVVRLRRSLEPNLASCFLGWRLGGYGGARSAIR